MTADTFNNAIEKGIEAFNGVLGRISTVGRDAIINQGLADDLFGQLDACQAAAKPLDNFKARAESVLKLADKAMLMPVNKKALKKAIRAAYNATAQAMGDSGRLNSPLERE